MHARGNLTLVKSEAERQITDITRDLLRAGRKARRRGSPRDWHRLRTTSRRLRGTLTAFANVLDRTTHARVTKRAKQLTKLPTEVRDLDVALDNLRLLAARAARGSERRAAKEMRRKLERKRRRVDRSLRRALERRRPVHKLARKLRKALRRHRALGRKVSPSADALGAAARTVLDRRAAMGAWEDAEGMHAFRVAVKKYRGALAAWSEAHGQTREHRGAIEALGRLQTILGEHHDWSELAGRLDRHRLALASHGARHDELVGYEALLGWARHEQRLRFDEYWAEMHAEVPALVGPGLERSDPVARPAPKSAAAETAAN